MGTLKPARAVCASPYRVPRALAPVDLVLDSNEGCAPSLLPPKLARYPDAAPLTLAIATTLGLSADRVLVTAGADDAIDRACRAVLEPGRRVVLPVPGFEMVQRYARSTGAELCMVAWTEARFPLQATLDAVDAHTAMVVLTSPNNPSGCVISANTLRCIARALPNALVLLDLAYGEFADEDLTPVALEFPNVLVVRTFSKALGCAGLRVGYALGAPKVISWLRSVGPPYAVSSPSLELAERVWAQDEEQGRRAVSWVRTGRAVLQRALEDLDLAVWPSQANFLLFRVPDALWFRDAMAGLGVAVRAFPDRPLLRDCIRVAIPVSQAGLDRLIAAIRTVLAPQALLLDMDGVIADVSRSYREAILRTAADHGVCLSAEEVQAAKDGGGANNDWVLTRTLLQGRGVERSLGQIRECFEAHYQGGLWRQERLACAPSTLLRWAERWPLAVVTGRPRRDAERFLQSVDLGGLFGAVVCMEDAPSKPDPAPVQRALERLGVERAWMFGDTPADLGAARGAGVLPLGIGKSGLVSKGAARTWASLDDVEVLP